ncbi:uncharacterized transmembrane protein DDB_G0289901-like [Frankliniella occidentalis]|uniref:Uncharacterized transmembrane protein DDB_G0289901-like n=1 Tax=Frankliniella occidentalis TaxID=133901 RepID=A0A6J1TFE2_FRAOC|nr:uncharacterized transmembrane protein DDB_G0289901-like [Frankliniella occidentalis]
MAKFILVVLAFVAIQAASAAPAPSILGVSQGFLGAAKTKVDAAQGLTNAGIQAGSDGVNLGLDAAKNAEAAKSNALRGGVKIAGNVGTEAITQTRNLANHLPSAGGIRDGANLGLNAAQGALELGTSALTGLFTGAQGLVNSGLDAGSKLGAGVSGAAEGGVNAFGGAAGGAIGAKANAIGTAQKGASAATGAAANAVGKVANTLTGGFASGLTGAFGLLG